MPINAYTGLMGSGKSYEVVSSVMLDALAQGRRIVSNIDGLNTERITEYLISKRGIEEEKIGVVVLVSNEQVKSPNFFFHGSDVETIVQPGDLVCIDEAWRFWGAGEAIPEPHFIFFREHRHYAHPETNICCDLVLMVQDISDLNRKLKSVVELSFRTKKHKSLGLSKHYVVQVFEGYRMNAKTQVNLLQKKYDPCIFPLYSSYSGGKGKEVTIDKRQNLLLSKGFLIPIILVIALAAFGIPKVWQFFHPKPIPTKIDASSTRAPVSSGSASVSEAVVSSPTTLRIVGYYMRTDGEYIVLYTDGAYTRFAKARAFIMDGYNTTGFINGQPTAFYGVSQ